MSPGGMAITRFRPEDLQGFELAEPVLAGAEHFRASLLRLSARGDYFSVRKDGKLICIAGITALWPGVGEAWLGATGLARHYPLFMARDLKGRMDECARQMGLHRVQCTVLASKPNSLRWARMLGFEPEGLMRKFGPQKEDFYRFAKVEP